MPLPRSARHLLLAAATAGVGLCSPIAAAQPASGQQVDAEQAIAIEQEFRDWFRAQPRAEVFRLAQGEADRRLGALSIESLDAESLAALAPVLQFSPDLMDRARPRLDELSELETADGAEALATLVTLDFMRTRQPIVLDRIRAMLSHPGMMAALEQGRAITALQIIASTPPRNLTSLLDMLTALEPAFTAEDAHPDLMLVAPLFVSTVRQVDPRPATADRTNEMLDRVVDRARVLVAAEPADVDAATLNELALLVAGLDGAFARGELVDYPAPDFAFQWSSDDALPGRLSELKGRVVVLDFWATWCMPCVAAFPKVAELTEHYKDQPVTVLGVTHLQGTHIAGVGDETVTADDPELEYRLMGEYIDDKSITWPVVFSPEAAWLEYGVEAIPHIAIIGKDGRVRHRGLNPFMPAAEKQRLIDALLTEPYTPEG